MNHWPNVDEALVEKAMAPINRTNQMAVLNAVDECHIRQAAHDHSRAIIRHRDADLFGVCGLAKGCVGGFVPMDWDGSRVIV